MRWATFTVSPTTVYSLQAAPPIAALPSPFRSPLDPDAITTDPSHSVAHGDIDAMAYSAPMTVTDDGEGLTRDLGNLTGSYEAGDDEEATDNTARSACTPLRACQSTRLLPVRRPARGLRSGHRQDRHIFCAVIDVLGGFCNDAPEILASSNIAALRRDDTNSIFRSESKPAVFGCDYTICKDNVCPSDLPHPTAGATPGCPLQGRTSASLSPPSAKPKMPSTRPWTVFRTAFCTETCAISTC